MHSSALPPHPGAEPHLFASQGSIGSDLPRQCEQHVCLARCGDLQGAQGVLKAALGTLFSTEKLPEPPAALLAEGYWLHCAEVVSIVALGRCVALWIMVLELVFWKGPPSLGGKTWFTHVAVVSPSFHLWSVDSKGVVGSAGKEFSLWMLFSLILLFLLFPSF